MISKELAKELKDSDFPDIFMTDHENCNYHQVEYIDGIFYHVPSLKELIEALGSRFHALQFYDDKSILWIAYSYENRGFEPAGHIFKDGATPEEAVAKLWLELNKKEI